MPGSHISRFSGYDPCVYKVKEYGRKVENILFNEYDESEWSSVMITTIILNLMKT